MKSTASNPGGDVLLMAIVDPQRSGLPFAVYISEKQGRRDVRVNVAAGPTAPPFAASLAVRPNIEVVEGALSDNDFELVRRWIDLNRTAIIGYLERSLQDAADAVAALKPIAKP
jgi:hypothetical protein